ncbi:MAG: hypothetical protein AUK55_01315 [Syntrophobacteraceae bacterium CG2_30_61_12]|nr:MAG: hypothetical protein AUK55_01315 [Syntrophobacteraceae bacterium CG2_30_61_12]
MQVRTFRAPTISQALELVKKELGPDAIILSNKKVTPAVGKPQVEVMAAVDKETGKPDGNGGGARPAGQEIHNELKEIKGFLSMLISSKGYWTQLQMEEPLAEIYHGLLVRGLDEKYTYMLLKDIVGQLEDARLGKRELLTAFCRRLLDRIDIARPFEQFPTAAAHCFTFVGPTGVGKTTTLAKLAALLKVRYKLTVGVISIDTYRIGAVDQLKTYTDILELPFQVVQNHDDLQRARQHFGDYDVVLIDTIGKNYLDRQHIEDLLAVFEADGGYHHFLVLSATAKDEDLAQTIKNFSALKTDSLIFTKVDETLNHGSMLNQLLRFRRPLSYLGTGQRVPEDLLAPSRKQMLSLLFPVNNAQGA